MTANTPEESVSLTLSTAASSLQAAAESYRELRARISVRVSLINLTEPIELPLGAYRDGCWVPLKLESEFEMSDSNLVDELCRDGLIADLLLRSAEEVFEIVRDTQSRCDALGSASAAHRSAHG
jgi:hypothetical protein